MSTHRSASPRARQVVERSDLSADVLLWRDAAGYTQTFGVADQVTTRDIATGTSWSVPGRRHGQGNRTGDYFFTTLGEHVSYASLVEYTLLLLLDHQQSVAAVLAQPFQMRFRRNSETTRHVPDYFVVRVSGDQEVWDVRPYTRIDGRLKEGAALTREFCRSAGFSYFLFDGIHPIVRRNLEWLHAYSHQRYAPVEAIDRLDVLVFFGAGRTLQDALEELGRPSRELRTWVYHLLWIGEIVGQVPGSGVARSFEVMG